MVSYGYRIRITRRDGSVSGCEHSCFSTPEDAVREEQKDLLKMGWAPPRWWQWWRWRDVPRRWPALSIESK